MGPHWNDDGHEMESSELLSCLRESGTKPEPFRRCLLSSSACLY
jgi:hypothetical protein